MREAGKKKKLKLKLPHLWNPHKIRQDDLFRSKDGTSNRSRRTDRVKRSADLPTTPFFHELWADKAPKNEKLRQFGIRKFHEKLVISLLFCNFIVENQ